MAVNLQHQDYTDENLANIIESSWNEWFSYDDVKTLFESGDQLQISTEPIKTSPEGLYLYGSDGNIDELEWDEEDAVVAWEDNEVVREVVILCRASYNVFETLPVKRTLERRRYASANFQNRCLVHYRVIHEEVNAQDVEEEVEDPDEDDDDYYDGDDDGGSGDEFEEAAEDGDDYPPDIAAPVAAAALAMDLAVDHPATDTAPVAAATLSSLHSDLRDDVLEKGCDGLDILQEAEDEVKTLNPLKSSEGYGGLDILQEAEVEVKTLNPLKSSEMKSSEGCGGLDILQEAEVEVNPLKSREGCGGLDILQEAEVEVKTLNPLKSSEMKKRKRVFKKNEERRIDDCEKEGNRFSAVRGAHKKIKRAEKAESKIPGDIAQSDILASRDGEVDKAKEEGLSGQDILDKTD